MFNKFAHGARTAVVLAQEEARDAGDRRIAPGHLLLGIAGSTGVGHDVLAAAGLDQARVRALVRGEAAYGLDADALASVGIDLDAVRARAEESFGEGALGHRFGSRPSGHVPFTRSAKTCLEKALRSAVRLQDGSIDSGHVLLGVLAVEDGVVRGVLRTAEVEPTTLAVDVEHRLRDAA